MKIYRFSAGILAAALATGLSTGSFSTGSWADDQADFEKAMTAAREAREQAAAVGGEWRDIGKFLQQAEQAAAKGDFATANKLAEKARQQGELGYEQAMSQKDVGLPDYMIAGSDKGKEPAASIGEAPAKK